MTNKDAVEIVGGLSAPSKMPCFGYSISAFLCKTGGKLREVAGSVCSKCYALKGFYRFDNTAKALRKRAEKINDPRWVEAMTHLLTHRLHLKKKDKSYFRWHDSGDIQSVEHLEKIIAVVKATPQVNHWLPTREIGFLQVYKLRHGAFPDNITIRLSGMKIDGPAPKSAAKNLGVLTSTVSTGDFNCPASLQDNECKDCRLCWDRNTENVAYHAH